MLLDEIQQALRKLLKERNGSIMLVTVGLVILILLITGAALHWSANLVLNQRRYNVTDLEKMEYGNANLVINAIIRERMLKNNPDLFDTDAISEFQDNLSRDPSAVLSGNTNIGFYFVSGSLQVPTWSNWMTNNSAFSQETFPRPDNPLFSLWHIPYPAAGNVRPTNFDILYQLYYWDGGSNKTEVLDTTRADRLPNLTNGSYYFTNSVHVREMPSSQIQILAVDQFDTTKMGGRINIASTNGTAFFPYGVIQGTAIYNGNLGLGGSANSSTLVVAGLTTQNTPASSFPCNPNKLVTRPNLGASWMMDPYMIPEADAANNYQFQKFYNKSEVIHFDGMQIWCDQVDGSSQPITDFPGITVSKTFTYPAGYKLNGATLVNPVTRNYGMKRLIIDLRALIGSKVGGQDGRYSFYIDCTTPMAKQRGVVVIGAEDTGLPLTSILTNGALRLEDSHTDSPIIVGTSYGGIVFTAGDDGAGNTITSSTWNAYVINTVRPPVPSFVSGNAADLGPTSINFDSVQIKGESGSGKIGFGYYDNTSGSYKDSCYFQISGLTAQAYVVINGTPQAVGSVSMVGSDFEITYKRSINALSINSHTGSNTNPWGGEEIIPLSGYLPRFEVTHAFWSGNNVQVIGRSSGSSFYVENAMTSVAIKGGIAVGQFIGGNIPLLNIFPSDNSTAFFTYTGTQVPASDRFLLFDP